MSWKFWKKTDKPEEATRPASLGGPSKVGGYSGSARGPVDPIPPKTRGTLGPKPPVQVSFLESAPDDFPSRDYVAQAVQGKDHRRQDLKDFTYGQIALQIAGLGTCCRLKVGCVLLTKEGRVAGMGYNGAGPGMPHCNENHCNENCRCVRTLHAEQNALSSSNAAPYTAFVTHEPCLGCTKELLIAGVRRVRYLKPYTSMPPAETTARAEWIEHYGVDWQQQTTLP